MRLSHILLSLILIALSFSCVRNEPNGIPQWLEKRIQIVEKGHDIYSTYSITEYSYNNNLVYYFSTYFENEFNYVYNLDGELIGAPDGGSDNQGDGQITDFFAKSQNNGIVWEEDKEPSLSNIYDYWFFNNMLNLNFGTSIILLQRETMFPNYYEQILDTLRAHQVDVHYMIMASYDTKNSEANLLVDSLIYDPINMISKSHIDSVLGTSGWEGFAELHPEFPGYCEFALPSYDPVDSIGLFVFAFHFGEDKRYWRITLGELIDDEWQLMQDDSTGEYYMYDNENVFNKPSDSQLLKTVLSDF